MARPVFELRAIRIHSSGYNNASPCPNGRVKLCFLIFCNTALSSFNTGFLQKVIWLYFSEGGAELV